MVQCILFSVLVLFSIPDTICGDLIGIRFVPTAAPFDRNKPFLFQLFDALSSAPFTHCGLLCDGQNGRPRIAVFVCVIRDCEKAEKVAALAWWGAPNGG